MIIAAMNFNTLLLRIQHANPANRYTSQANFGLEDSFPLENYNSTYKLTRRDRHDCSERDPR